MFNMRAKQIAKECQEKKELPGKGQSKHFGSTAGPVPQGKRNSEEILFHLNLLFI